MDGLLKDTRYAFRALRRQPAFALITVLTMALFRVFVPSYLRAPPKATRRSVD